MITAASASSSTLDNKNTFRRSAQHNLLVCRYVCNYRYDGGGNGLDKGLQAMFDSHLVEVSAFVGDLKHSSQFLKRLISNCYLMFKIT